MTFTQLKVLRAVGRCGSLTRAALELKTSQPSVSHSLKSLELELGVRLCVRRHDGVTLTPIGRTVSRLADNILSQRDALTEAVARERNDSDYRLKVGTIPSVNAKLLSRAVHSFTSSRNRCEVSVLEGSDMEVVEWLRTGAVDLATVTASDGDLITTPLVSDHMVAVLPTEHRLARQQSVTITEIAREPFIMSSGGCEPLISAIATGANARLRPHYRIRDTASILTMVTEGLGVTIMPALALPTAMSGLCVVPLCPRQSRTVLLAVLADAPVLPLARTFIEYASSVAAAAGREHEI
jgi:DNA-binding transcriptional LysR family regulator